MTNPAKNGNKNSENSRTLNRQSASRTSTIDLLILIFLLLVIWTIENSEESFLFLSFWVEALTNNNWPIIALTTIIIFKDQISALIEHGFTYKDKDGAVLQAGIRQSSFNQRSFEDNISNIEKSNVNETANNKHSDAIIEKQANSNTENNSEDSISKIWPNIHANTKNYITNLIPHIEKLAEDKTNETENLTKKEYFLAKSLQFFIEGQFLRIYDLIFQSQIKALQELTFHNITDTVETVMPIYEKAKENNKEFYKTYSFNDWIKYLESVCLLYTDKEKVYITDKGRAFIQFIKDNEKVLAKKYY
jgi:hypothetical protein